jgi:signal transduction histidine kinase
MNADVPVTLHDAWTEALAAWVQQGDEEALSRAYELGRDALTQGLGVVEIAAIHSRALASVEGAVSVAQHEVHSKAHAFFEEAITPFEMALRGFREANERLRNLNEDLTARNTQLDRAREAAEAAARELEEFTSSVSHDLRGPARRVHGFATMLAEDCASKLDDVGRGHIARIQASAERMGQLIEDLLRLSRIARNELAREPCDVSAIARTILGHLAAQDPQRRVDVVVPDGLTVNADRALLVVLLENLLGNAWKFTSKTANARIEIGMDSTLGPDGNDRDELFVKDNGAGFDTSFAQRMFVPFQRFHTAAEFEGTGVGLATVERIVRRHGGRVRAESTPGHGATFAFTLG